MDDYLHFQYKIWYYDLLSQHSFERLKTKIIITNYKLMGTYSDAVFTP